MKRLSHKLQIINHSRKIELVTIVVMYLKIKIFFLREKKRADHAHKKCSQILIPIIGKQGYYIMIKIKRYLF